MAFQVSPGVNVTEQDLTLGVRGVSTSKGAFAGFFQWGPVEQRVLVSSEDNLVKKFSKPNGFNAAYWFSAANFLAYAGALEIVRHVNDAVNATSSGTGVLVKNEDDYDAKVLTDTNAFLAKYPGSLGNGLIVSIGTQTNFATWTYSGAFDSAPESADEVHVAIVDGDGVWSGTAGLVLERFPFLSLIEGTRAEDGTNIYIKDAINNRSQYVWVGGEFQLGDDTVQEDFLSQAISVTTETFTEGVDITAGAGVVIDLVTDIDGLDVVVTRDDGVEAVLVSPTDYTISYDTGGLGEDQVTVATVNVSDVIRVYVLDSASVNVITAEDIDGDDVIVVKQDATTLVEGDDYTIDEGTNTISINQYGSNVSLDPYVNLTSGINISVISGGADEYILSGGSDDTAVSNRITSYNLWSNAEESDISLIISGPANQTEVASLISLAESRKDVVVFISPEQTDVVNNFGNEVDDVVAFRNSLTSSSYAFLDSNWKYQYDRYNDVYRWVPCNGDVAGLAANTDSVADPWFSIAGYTRGLIRNVIKLAWNPDKASRDELYKSGVNPIITEAGEGTLLYGDKTLLSRPSAFDRINVRRLFIVLEKTIARSAKFQLFEFNDEFTRAQFKNIVEPFLRDVQGRRGVFDFRVICDETNNTPEVIDRNEFVGDIYIKPARSINFIQLNFVAVRTGVDFEEIIGG